jgi:hypothetical protein
MIDPLRSGLATVHRERPQCGGRPSEVVRVRRQRTVLVHWSRLHGKPADSASRPFAVNGIVHLPWSPEDCCPCGRRFKQAFFVLVTTVLFRPLRKRGNFRTLDEPLNPSSEGSRRRGRRSEVSSPLSR